MKLFAKKGLGITSLYPIESYLDEHWDGDAISEHEVNVYRFKLYPSDGFTIDAEEIQIQQEGNAVEIIIAESQPVDTLKEAS
jgi:hypothetical protein